MMGALLTKPSRRDSNKAYIPVPIEESNVPARVWEHEATPTPTKDCPHSVFVTVLILLAPVSYVLLRRSAGSQAFNRTSLRIQHDSTGSFVVCPEDPSSARESGCSFDLLANGWIPAPCFDSTMHHDFVDGSDYGLLSRPQRRAKSTPRHYHGRG